MTHRNLSFGNYWKLVPATLSSLLVICPQTRDFYVLSSNFAVLSRPLYLAVHKPFANPHENFQSLIYLSWRKQLRTSFPQTWGQESQACCSYLELDCCRFCRRVCAVQMNNVEGRDASEQDSSQLDNPLWESTTNHNKVTVKLRKLWTPGIPMECYCVARKKAN